MLKRHFSNCDIRSDAPPVALSSVLLVDMDTELRDARRLLLGALHLPVLALASYVEVCKLPIDNNCSLVAISLNLSQNEVSRIATYVRRHWPSAKILLLGQLYAEFDDPLYDEVVHPYCNPSGVIDAARRLLNASRFKT